MTDIETPALDRNSPELMYPDAAYELGFTQGLFLGRIEAILKGELPGVVEMRAALADFVWAKACTDQDSELIKELVSHLQDRGLLG